MAKAKTAPKTRRQRRGVTRADFVGTKMANLLLAVAQSAYTPEYVRQEATKLQEQWDSICAFRLNNPIVLVELEAKLFPKDSGGSMAIYGTATIEDYQRQGYGK
jgi:hypothetical protein